MPELEKKFGYLIRLGLYTENIGLGDSESDEDEEDDEAKDKTVVEKVETNGDTNDLEENLIAEDEVLRIIGFQVVADIADILADQYGTEALEMDVWESRHEYEDHLKHTIFYLDLTTDQSLALSLLAEIAEISLKDNKYFWLVGVENRIFQKPN